MLKRKPSKEVQETIETFSLNLALLREKSKLTATELGGLVGVTQGAISNIENGRHLPTVTLYKKLCRVLKQPAPPML